MMKAQVYAQRFLASPLGAAIPLVRMRELEEFITEVQNNAFTGGVAATMDLHAATLKRIASELAEQSVWEMHEGAKA